jgi:hypothetical protein
VQRSLAHAGAFVPPIAALLLGLILSAAPRAILAADYDVEVDACSLLDGSAIEALTDWTDFTTDGGRSSASDSSCFWGSVRAGEPGYVELVVLRQTELDPQYRYDDDCVVTAVSDVGEDAAFVECPTEVSLYAYERGAVVSLLVDQPAEPLTADDLAAVVRSVFDQLGSLAASEGPLPVTSPPADWSPRGVSTYEGAWTLTAYATDGEGFEPEYEVGDSRPGSIELTCTVQTGDDACGFVATIDDGAPWHAATLEREGSGELRNVTDIELDNCEDGQIDRTVITARYGAETATAVVEDLVVPRTCTWDNSTLYAEDLTWTFEGTLVDYVPEGPLATTPASAAPSPDAPGAAPTSPTGAGAPSAVDEFAKSIPTAEEISTDPTVILQSAALAALLVFLMPFPSQLFNSTLETHEDEVKGWLQLDRLGAVAGGAGALWASWPGVVLFTILAALLYGFLDPGFGFDLGSLATFLGMLLGIVLVTAAFAIPTVMAHRRHGDRPSLKVVPVSLLIGVVCVLLSRLTDFQPGYLYGLLIGLAFARELSAADEGRASAIGAVAMLGVALVSWIGLGALPEGESFGLAVGRTALAALMVAGLEGVVFGLLPMRFLPGEPLYRWNRVLWAGLLLIGAFAFFHILINPASGYLSDTSRAPLFTVLALLLGFTVVSVAFWAWFRYRPAGSGPDRAST